MSSKLPEISFYDKLKIAPQLLDHIQEKQKQYFDDLDTIFSNVQLRHIKDIDDHRINPPANIPEASTKIRKDHEKRLDGARSVAKRYTVSYFSQFMKITGDDEILSYKAINSAVSNFAHYASKKYYIDNSVVDKNALDMFVNKVELNADLKHNTDQLKQSLSKLDELNLQTRKLKVPEGASEKLFDAYFQALSEVFQIKNYDLKKAIATTSGHMGYNKNAAPNVIVSDSRYVAMVDKYNLHIDK